MAITEPEQIYQKTFCLPDWLTQQGYESVFIQSADGSFENRRGLVKNLGFKDFIAGEDMHREGAKELGYFAQDDAYILPSLENWLAKKRNKPALISIFNSNTHHTYDIAAQPCKGDSHACFMRALEYYDGILEKVIKLVENVRGKDNTLFVILGDHGEAFGEKGLYQHDGVPYEEVVNVPLIFYGVDIAAGKDHYLRWLLDIPLTFMHQYTGRQPESTQMGKSLFATDGHTKLVSYCWYERSCMSVRDKYNKYVIHLKTGKVEVYPVINHVDESEELEKADQLQIEQAVRYGFSLRNAVNSYHKKIYHQSETTTPSYK